MNGNFIFKLISFALGILLTSHCGYSADNKDVDEVASLLNGMTLNARDMDVNAVSNFLKTAQVKGVFDFGLKASSIVDISQQDPAAVLTNSNDMLRLGVPCSLDRIINDSTSTYELIETAKGMKTVFSNGNAHTLTPIAHNSFDKNIVVEVFTKLLDTFCWNKEHGYIEEVGPIVAPAALTRERLTRLQALWK